MTEHVFVYGTLKRGFANHGVMTRARARLLCAARTAAAHPLVIGERCGLPYLLPEPGAGVPVAGEVYVLGRAGLAALDAFEGVDQPRFYRRARLLVALDRAASPEIEALPEIEARPEIEAWAYFRERAHIAGGCSAPMAAFASRS